MWVIAETTDLPTKFTKIVVTDDRGRYLIPDLPKANYRVWVRGFGLVDSPKVPGVARASPRPYRRAGADEKEAAQYYPAMYWWALLNPPQKSEFPLAEDQEPGRVAQHHQGRRLWLVPCARHARHPDYFPGSR